MGPRGGRAINHAHACQTLSISLSLANNSMPLISSPNACLSILYYLNVLSLQKPHTLRLPPTTHSPQKQNAKDIRIPSQKIPK